VVVQRRRRGRRQASALGFDESVPTVRAALVRCRRSDPRDRHGTNRSPPFFVLVSYDAIRPQPRGDNGS
jgi:hypothetical protein